MKPVFKVLVTTAMLMAYCRQHVEGSPVAGRDGKGLNLFVSRDPRVRQDALPFLDEHGLPETESSSANQEKQILWSNRRAKAVKKGKQPRLVNEGVPNSYENPYTVEDDHSPPNKTKNTYENPQVIDDDASEGGERLPSSSFNFHYDPYQGSAAHYNYMQMMQHQQQLLQHQGQYGARLHDRLSSFQRGAPLQPPPQAYNSDPNHFQPMQHQGDQSMPHPYNGENDKNDAQSSHQDEESTNARMHRFLK
ncbi:hypothetical protein CBS101457_002629 [Exobasidium rhododendri]|nr:hypothetical protein CBS101457_002629 [Exobasidium rhododendri]